MNKQINWALVGTGGISNKFITGLKATEGKAAAVVSRNMKNAQDFATQYGIKKAFDNYDKMLEDNTIDVVYIGTPHTTHKDLTIRALKAKKAVLCEKPISINACELREMILTAQENNVFFMEAMWTRFIPPLVKVRDWLQQGLIGDVNTVQANFGFNAQYDPENRLFNPHLGGGALLDAGIYPLSMISMIYGGKKPVEIKSQVVFGKSGVDEQNIISLSYGENRLASASSAICTAMENDLWIYGTHGKIHVPNFIWSRCARLLVDDIDDYIPELISNGYNYQAEAVMNCIREGIIECPVMSWGESLVLMETMDAIREQWGFRYPGES